VGVVVVVGTVVVVGGTVVVVGGTVVVVGGTVVVVGGTVVVVVGGVVVPPQLPRLMRLLSSVTAPFRASTRPRTVVPVFTLIEVSARIVPTNVVFVSRVAELPTCQNTLQGFAPLISRTVLFGAVISVDCALKMNTESEDPCPSSVRVPVSPSVSFVYTPANSVVPPSSVATFVSGVWPAALL
jgi:hypothetical protein